MTIVLDARPDYVLGRDLRSIADRAGGQVALRHGGTDTTYAALANLADRVARRLSGLGVRRGDRVVVLSPSPLPVLAVVHGAALLGAVAVPANWRQSAAGLADVAADAGARVLVVDDEVRNLVVDLAGVTVVDANVETWEDAPRSPAAPPSEVAVQIYTSGTSGRPKGVLVTTDNLACKVRAMGRDWGLTPLSTSLLATPLFHVGGLCWALVTHAAGGLLVVPDSTRPGDVADTVLGRRVTHAFLVPKLLTDLVDDLARRDVRPTSLEVVLCGAAPVGVSLQQRAAAVLDCRILQVYGLTETTGSITQLDVTAALVGADPEGALRSSGHPYAWVELAIRDPDDRRLCPPGVPGEIWTRSAQNCGGYWHRPEETADLLVDGWLRTGDGGYLDDDGRLHVTDRLKDMIVSGGENIYSVEVERALVLHPAVRDVAVVGRADDEWGEVVVAVVELADGQRLSLDEAAEHVAARIGRYKRPRALHVVDALPRNAGGKVLKHRVRGLASSARPTTEVSS